MMNYRQQLFSAKLLHDLSYQILYIEQELQAVGRNLLIPESQFGGKFPPTTGQLEGAAGRTSVFESFQNPVMDKTNSVRSPGESSQFFQRTCDSSLEPTYNGKEVPGPSGQPVIAVGKDDTISLGISKSVDSSVKLLLETNHQRLATKKRNKIRDTTKRKVTFELSSDGKPRKSELTLSPLNLFMTAGGQYPWSVGQDEIRPKNDGSDWTLFVERIEALWLEEPAFGEWMPI